MIHKRKRQIHDNIRCYQFEGETQFKQVIIISNVAN